MLRKALDSGIRVLNTADFYTGLGEGDEVSSNIKFIGAPLGHASAAIIGLHHDHPCRLTVQALDPVIGPWL